MLFRKITSFIFFCVVSIAGQSQQISLSNGWQFKSEHTEKYYPATVPGSVYTDLMMNKLIKNPFSGTVEKELHWIDTTNWIYEINVEVDKVLLGKKNIELVFDGIDTYAKVYLNHHLLLSTDNMFRQWVCDIKPFLTKGSNNIQIHFKAATPTVDSIATSNLPLVRPDHNRVYARKAQYQFGWDWGPTFTGCGIWKKVWIEGYDDLSQREKEQQQKNLLYQQIKNPVALIQKKDSIGKSFYFEKKGTPIYMKGANWIPASIFPSSTTKENYIHLLSMAKAANMNMLRVWGGGIYESDDFYDICDSLGIYVWQDFMFAGGMYPADKKFLDNVKEEVKYQIQRLRHHPCIVVWCGNNEIDEAWKNWGWQNQFNLHNDDSVKIWNEYETLFKDSLRLWVKENDSLRPYISTSPTFGWGNEKSYTEGDSHYWGLWWGLMDWEIFNKKT
jgi:beta-mannosidase